MNNSLAKGLRRRSSAKHERKDADSVCNNSKGALGAIVIADG